MPLDYAYRSGYYDDMVRLVRVLFGAAFKTNDSLELLRQINDRNYEEKLLDDGMTTIRKYGIACYKRHCKVLSG